MLCILDINLTDRTPMLKIDARYNGASEYPIQYAATSLTSLKYIGVGIRPL